MGAATILSQPTRAFPTPMAAAARRSAGTGSGRLCRPFWPGIQVVWPGHYEQPGLSAEHRAAFLFLHAGGRDRSAPYLQQPWLPDGLVGLSSAAGAADRSLAPADPSFDFRIRARLWVAERTFNRISQLKG